MFSLLDTICDDNWIWLSIQTNDELIVWIVKWWILKNHFLGLYDRYIPVMSIYALIDVQSTAHSFYWVKSDWAKKKYIKLHLIQKDEFLNVKILSRLKMLSKKTSKYLSKKNSIILFSNIFNNMNHLTWLIMFQICF